MPRFPALLLFLASTLAAASAVAAGLGMVRGETLIGRELRLSVPVEGISPQHLTRDCLRMRNHASDQAGQYLPPKPRLEVLQENGTTALIVSGDAIREPVVAFTLSIECGVGFERAYQVFAELPSSSLPVAAPAREMPAQRRSSSSTAEPMPKPRAQARSSAPATKAHNLLLMSRQRYPDSPRTRERFIRIMLDANPSLSSRHTPIDPALSLVFPDELPPLPAPTGSTESRSPPPREAGALSRQTVAAQPSQPGAPIQTGKAPPPDRLVVGRAPAGLDAQIMDELVQIIPLMKEQNQFQLALMAKLTRVEAELALLQQQQGLLEQQHQALAKRFNALEAERLAEKQAASTSSFGFLELIAATLAGGILGGLSLLALQRWQNLRGPSPGSTTFDVFSHALPANAATVTSSPAASASTDVAALLIKTDLPTTGKTDGDDPHLHLFDFPLGTLPSSRDGQPAESGDAALDFSVQGTPPHRP